MGVIPNPKMTFIFPISCILALIFPILIKYFPKCEGKGSFLKFQIKSLPFKLLQLSLLPVRMKKIHPKMKPLEWSQHFSHYKSTGIFSLCSRATNSSAGGLIWQNSNPFQVLWLSLLPAPIKNKGARVVTRLLIYFSNAQGQLTQ